MFYNKTEARMFELFNEETFSKMQLIQGQWHMGIIGLQEHCLVFIRDYNIDYDILLPNVFHTQDEASEFILLFTKTK